MKSSYPWDGVNLRYVRKGELVICPTATYGYAMQHAPEPGYLVSTIAIAMFLPERLLEAAKEALDLSHVKATIDKEPAPTERKAGRSSPKSNKIRRRLRADRSK